MFDRAAEAGEWGAVCGHEHMFSLFAIDKETDSGSARYASCVPGPRLIAVVRLGRRTHGGSCQVTFISVLADAASFTEEEHRSCSREND